MNAFPEPSDFRPGDQFHSNSPWHEDPTPFESAQQALQDALWLLKCAASYADEGKTEAAMAEAQNAIEALDEAIESFEESRKQ